METWERDERARSHGHEPSAGLRAPQPSSVLWENIGQNRARVSECPRPVSPLVGSPVISQGGGGGSKATGEPRGTFWRELVLTLRASGNLRKRKSCALSLCPSLSVVRLAPGHPFFLFGPNLSFLLFYRPPLSSHVFLSFLSGCLFSFLQCHLAALLTSLALLHSPDQSLLAYLYLHFLLSLPPASPIFPLGVCCFPLSIASGPGCAGCCPLSPPQQ